MTVYAVAQINIHDMQRYDKYQAGFMDIFNQHNGTILAVDDAPIVIEGEWPYTRTVIIEFPSKADFDAWYQSREYQTLLQDRLAASVASLALVAGFANG